MAQVKQNTDDNSSFKDVAKDLAPGSFFGVGMSAAQNFIDGLFQRSNLDYQAQLNEAAAEKAYQRQLDFWYKQNAYNDPSAQIRRLKQAGLNPAMLNGNGVNNTAGGLSSTPMASPGSASTPKGDAMSAIAGLANFAYQVKQMGFIDAQTAKAIEERMTIVVERELKKLDGVLKLTESEKAQLEYEEMYEALFEQGIDGRAPRIKNNRYLTQIQEARSRLRVNAAQESYTNAQESYTKALEVFAGNRDSREAAESLASLAVQRATARAQVALAEKTANDDLRAANEESRRQAMHEIQMEIQEYLRDIQASEAEIAKVNEYIASLWSSEKDDFTFGDIGAMILDFIHSNLRLGGSASYSRSTK